MILCNAYCTIEVSLTGEYDSSENDTFGRESSIILCSSYFSMNVSHIGEHDSAENDTLDM